MYAGLDLSLTQTGVCVMLDSTSAVTSGEGSKVLKGMPRVKTIVEHIKMVFNEFAFSIDLCAIEGYALYGPGHKFYQAELCGVVKWHLEEWCIPYIVVPPNSAKQFLTGNGKADKIQMCEVIRDVYGKNLLHEYKGTKKKPEPPVDWGAKETHWKTDEADAFGLAQVAALYDGGWDKHPTLEQLSIIEGIRLDPTQVLTKASKARAQAKK